MIEEYVKTIMQNGICHFAKELEKPTTDLQILILWDEQSQEVKYKKMVRDGESHFVKFNEILNVKFDLLNREMICANFISKTLDKFATELSCQKSNLFVVIYLLNSQAQDQEDEDKELKLFLYRNAEAIKEIELEEILS